MQGDYEAATRNAAGQQQLLLLCVRFGATRTVVKESAAEFFLQPEGQLNVRQYQTSGGTNVLCHRFVFFRFIGGFLAEWYTTRLSK